MNTNFYNDKHNELLLENVSAKNKSNPQAQEIYNLVVVGAGSAGLISAIIAAGLGAKVALVEKHLMGGDCLNTGCVPSKSLISSSRLAKEMKDSENFGISSPHLSIVDDFPKIIEQVRKIRAQISKHDSAKRFSSFGIDVFFGDAAFSNEHTLVVDNQNLVFDKAVIATGARAVKIPIEGISEEDYYTNENIFEIDTLPQNMLFLGGGPIGCELAQAFSRLGSKVNIVQRGAFLPREDADASKLLAEVFKEDGINVMLDAELNKVEKLENGKKKAYIQDKDKNIVELEIDALFVGLGRAANVENLGLEKALVAYDRNGIKVNDNLCTSNSNIYAAGDCCMLYKFTHAAEVAAQIVVQNALFFGKKKLSDVNMPWCTYTEPEIAHVGMYEKDALEKNIQIEFYRFDMNEVDRAIADRQELGFVKIMCKKGSDKILGATIVASHAGEMISEISTAMKAKMGLSALSTVIHPYPTQASAIQRAAQQYRKKKFTANIAKIFKIFLSFRLSRARKRIFNAPK